MYPGKRRSDGRHQCHPSGYMFLYSYIFMVVTQMLSSGMDVKLPSKNRRRSSRCRSISVLSIKPPEQPQSDEALVYIDRDLIESEGMTQTILDAMNENNLSALPH